VARRRLRRGILTPRVPNFTINGGPDIYGRHSSVKISTPTATSIGTTIARSIPRATQSIIRRPLATFEASRSLRVADTAFGCRDLARRDRDGCRTIVGDELQRSQCQRSIFMIASQLGTSALATSAPTILHSRRKPTCAVKSLRHMTNSTPPGSSSSYSKSASPDQRCL